MGILIGITAMSMFSEKNKKLYSEVPTIESIKQKVIQKLELDDAQIIWVNKRTSKPAFSFFWNFLFGIKALSEWEAEREIWKENKSLKIENKELKMFSGKTVRFSADMSFR